MQKIVSISSIIATLTFGSLAAQAMDLHYTYQWSNGAYRCVNKAGKVGYNKDYYGECGDVSYKVFDSLTMNKVVKGLQSIGAIYHQANLSGAGLIGCDFSKAEMNSGNLNGARIYNTRMNSAQMERASFVGGLMTQASFNNSNLMSASFASSSVGYTSFHHANLYYSTFAGSLLTNVSFDKADARDASFAYATLRNVSFKNADLRGASFEEAKIREGVDWAGAKFDSYTRLPFSRDEAEQKGMILE